MPRHSDIEALHELSVELLHDWEEIPTDRREKRAMELLVEACICLSSCSINLGENKARGANNAYDPIAIMHLDDYPINL